jgi:hypothetical protein
MGIQSANPHEVTLVEKTVDDRFVEEMPERLFSDTAYDSIALDERLKERV